MMNPTVDLHENSPDKMLLAKEWRWFAVKSERCLVSRGSTLLCGHWVLTNESPLARRVGRATVYIFLHCNDRHMRWASICGGTYLTLTLKWDYYVKLIVVVSRRQSSQSVRPSFYLQKVKVPSILFAGQDKCNTSARTSECWLPIAWALRAVF